MTDDLTALRGRQDRLEGRVTVLEATVKEEAGLRAKMDSDHTRRLTRIEDKVGKVEHTVGEIQEELGDVRIGVHAILDLLDTHFARKPGWAALAGTLRRNHPRGDIQRGN